MASYDALFAHLFHDYRYADVWDMPADLWRRRKHFADVWLSNRNQPWEAS